MQRDIVFLAVGIPQGRPLRGISCFVEPLPEVVVTNLRNLAKQVPSLRGFLEKHSGRKFAYIGVRNAEEQEDDSLANAWQVMDGIIDGFRLLRDLEDIDVSNVVQIREGDSTDCLLKLYSKRGWAMWDSKDPELNKSWQEREKCFADHILHFFEVVANSGVGCSGLGAQIQYSAKMFRHGSEAQVFGVEYLCKFSALEGLVCGSVRRKKQALLTERLRTLFRRSPRKIEDDVAELWDLRCVASHQGNAFHFEEIPCVDHLGGKIELVEFLFIGSLVFALSQVGQKATVDELWKDIATYDLPDYALLERGKVRPKVPLLRFILNTHLDLKGAGNWMDNAYLQPREKDPAES